ncbi:MAG: PLP-dependent transferase, partial [Bacteroidetes bacterium]|nr:PLP-dependent transferase [Bacteroidota bacterium]
RAEWFSPANDGYNLAKLEEMVHRVKPQFLYFEVISNPMLIIADAAEVINICKRNGVKVIVDNTFATPYLLKPLDYGANLVIHSGTKYFSGHGNLTAGVLCGNGEELMRDAVAYRKFVGHMLSPDDAYRLHTQIQTFALRFPVQCENAFRTAKLLAGHHIIEKVWYPGLTEHSTNNIADRLFGGKGYGAMVTFTFRGDAGQKRQRRDMFIEHVSDKIRLVPTLGDPHTILMPVEPVWGDRYPDPGMIRLSVGFESFDELEATLSEALEGL